MSLISMEFLFVCAGGSGGYYLIPKKYQWLWLLVFSYIYYASSGVKLLLFGVYDRYNLCGGETSGKK